MITPAAAEPADAFDSFHYYYAIDAIDISLLRYAFARRYAISAALIFHMTLIISPLRH